MTRKPVRTKVAVATTTVGVAVLLAGPMNTFGLGVPSTGDVAGTTTQVTSTVQGAVDTTQQTAATTVTNVESTVQTTVQTTTQAVAPQPAATTPAQTSAPTASKQVATRVAAPVKKQVSAVSRPRTQGKPAAAPVRLAQKAGGASVESVRVAATKHTRVARTQRVAAPALTTGTRAQDAPLSCDVPALAALPGGAQLQALLAIVCDAANGLDLPTRIGLAGPGTDTSAPALGDVRGASARGTAGAAPAHSASLGGHPNARVGAPQPAGSAGASQLGEPIGGPTGAAVLGHGRGLGSAGPIPYAHISPAAAAADHASASGSGHHHHTWFSGQSRGTEILMAILFANLAILGGIALWRLAVRFVIPRFA